MPPNGTFAKTFQNISRMSGREIKPTSPSQNTQGSGCFLVYPGHSPTHKSYGLQNKSSSLEQQPSFITGLRAPFFPLLFFFFVSLLHKPKVKVNHCFLSFPLPARPLLRPFICFLLLESGYFPLPLHWNLAWTLNPLQTAPPRWRAHYSGW